MHEIAYLPTITLNHEVLGEPIETAAYDRMVFCEKSSQPRNEFYQKESVRGGQVGLRRSIVLIVNAFEYDMEETIQYKERVYTIYRTFDRTDERTELYCEGRSG